jgi:hypothetical protein
MARLEKPVVPASPSGGTFPHVSHIMVTSLRSKWAAGKGSVSAGWRIGVSGDAFSQRVAR